MNDDLFYKKIQIEKELQKANNYNVVFKGGFYTTELKKSPKKATIDFPELNDVE